MNNRVRNNTTNQSWYQSIYAKLILWIAGILIGISLLDVGMAYAKVPAPRLGNQTTLQALWNTTKSELNPKDPAYLSGIRGVGAATKNFFSKGMKGKWNLGNFNPGKQMDRIRSYSRDGSTTVEAKRYNDMFKKWNSGKHVNVKIASGLHNLNNSKTTIEGISNDSRLSAKQNKAIKSEIQNKYNAWYKKQMKKNGKVTKAEAEAEIMNLTGDAYNDVLKHGSKRDKKIAEEVNAELNKAGNKATKDNNKNLKNISSGESEPKTFSGKVAKAFLDLFYSSDIGKWMESSGAGATIFGLQYSSGQSAQQMYQQIANSYNENGYNEIYPATAYTASVQNVGVAIGPMFVALSAVLIVITVIIQATKMGVGQAIDPVRYRQEWFRSLFDTAFAVVGVLNYNLLLSVVLSINGAIVTGLAGFMAGTTTASGNSILSEAVTLGFSKTTINMLTSGTFLGSEFVGIIFAVIYLMTYIGLAIYIKYYYFVREVVFTILWALGPVFIAFWPNNWGKYRTINWLREIIGTVMIQSIHALTMTFMAVLMAWNNGNWTKEVLDTKTKSGISSAGSTLGAIPGNLTHFNLIGATGNAVKAPLQVLGVTSPDVYVKNGALHFETMVIGFIIMVMFQPLSKSLAELFGLQTNMLNEIHQSTSRSLKAAATTAGGVAGIAIGGTALAAGAVTGGLGAASSLKALSSAGKAAKFAKSGQKLSAFKKAFGKSFRRSSPLNKARSASAKATTMLNGLAGKNMGSLFASSASLGAGDPWGAIAASRVGGEIGERAASLASGPLSKLALKNADPNREYKKHLKKQIDEATKGAAAKSLKDSIDKSAGFDDFIKKAQKAPDYKNNEKLQQAVKSAKDLKNFSEQAEKAGLDPDAAISARASRILKGNKNYKDANAVNAAFQKAIARDNSLTPAQKQAAIQAADKAMIIAGAPANDPKLMFDRQGYGDAEKAGDKARKEAEISIARRYKAGEIPGVDSNVQSFEDWKNSSQYKKLYQPQIDKVAKMAAQSALNASNGTFLNDVDHQAFQDGLKSHQGIVMNADTFKSEAVKGMSEAGISENKAQSIVQGATDPIAGRSLTQSVAGLGNQGETQILDSELWHQLNNQAANTINSTWAGAPMVSGNDLDSIYNGFGNVYGGMIGDPKSSPSAQNMTNYVDSLDSASYFNQGQQAWADFHNATQQAAEQHDPLSFATWFGNSGIFQSNPDSTSVFGTQAVGSNNKPTEWDLAAQDRMSANPYLKPDISGLSLAEAFDMMPKVTDGRNQPIGVRPGSFRMAIGNTNSMLQAQDANGNWFNVGNLGQGDGTLDYGDMIFQDLDLSANGVPSLAFDPTSHQIAQPYRYQDGTRTPATLINGVPSLDSFFSNSDFGTTAQTAPGDFAHLPNSFQLQRAQRWNEFPSVDQYPGYTDFALQGDKDAFVITGKNPYTGRREALTQQTVNNPTMSSLPANTRFSIPLKDNRLTGLDVDTSKDYHLYYSSGIRGNEREVAQKLFEDFYANDHSIHEMNDYMHDAMMPYTQPYLRNFLRNNSAFLSGTNLDTFRDPDIDDIDWDRFYGSIYDE